jgi:predicted TPR repeat methyltransferase
MLEELYTSGDYLEKNPDWHVGESPWKVVQALRMMQRHDLAIRTICEVGCGAGEILRQLQEKMDPTCHFWGYDISPQAYEFCKGKENDRLHYKLADIRQESDTFFDLILVFDVLEHLEDYFSFLRDIKPKSHYKLFHIPLDLSVQTMLRRNALLKIRDAYGHLHSFTKETALRSLEDTGYEVIDYFYTSSSVDLPSSVLSTRLLKIPRRVLFWLQKDFAARTLGGCRLLILAR